jgi:hypothetical protein
MCFRNEKQFQEKNWEKIDCNQLPFLFYHTTNIWLGIRLVNILFAYFKDISYIFASFNRR